MELLKKKFPNKQQNDSFEPINHRVTPLDRRLVVQTIKKLSKNSATAIDSWTRGLLIDPISVDPSIAEDLGIIIAMISSSTQTKNKEKEQDIRNNENPKKKNKNNNNIDEDESLLDEFGQPQQQQQPAREPAEHEFFDNLTMDMIRAARLIGIPKPDGGIRPIVISSFLAKLCGSCLLKRSNNVSRIPNQYAIGNPNGSKIVGHLARQQYQKGKAIVCVDLVNAYNTTKRKNIFNQMQQDSIDDDLLSYFCIMYHKHSNLVSYGPSGRTNVICSDEGIRQGDAPSSYFFCLVMRKVCDLITAKYTSNDQCSVYCYMDDMTIICDPQVAAEVIDFSIVCAEECGFAVNREKSAIICKEFIPINNNTEDSSDNNNLLNINNNTLSIPTASNEEPFKLLGVNVTNSFEEFNNNIIKRADRFFDSLDMIDVHPEIKHLILHFCGRPRLLYYCETTPPQFAKDVVQHFQHKMKSSFSKIIGVEDLDTIRDEMLHSAFGANLPDYFSHHEQIYNNTATYVETRSGYGAVRVELINTSKEDFTSLECSHDRQWTRYIAPTNVAQLTPIQYRTALAIRCKLIPDSFRKEIGDDYLKCDCETLMIIKNLTKQEEDELNEIVQQTPNAKKAPLVQHLIKCPAMHKLYDSTRHNLVKNALRHIANRHGISVYDEPTFYDYQDGLANRPDLTFCIPTQRPYITTDITIVQPSEKPGVIYVGLAAAEAANKKIQKHAAAVHQRDHQFIPFALETTGHFDLGAKELIRVLKSTLPYSQQYDFLRDMYGAVSTALAEYRAEVLINTLTHAKTRRQR